MKLAVKDLFDVAGYPNGKGHPNIIDKAKIADRHAPVVARLLDAGAEFCGKTLADELAFGLSGYNPHFGMPINPKAPKRLTGGSSSG